MKVFCNGFNLYGQLNLYELVVEEFTTAFEENCIRDICINHSFSILQTDNLSVFSKGEQKPINCDKVVQITSNDERLLILNEVGKLYKIEVKNFDLIHEIPNFLSPDEIPEEQIINVNCGSKLCVAYSNKGRLFNIPHKLNFVNVNIIDIRCGREHCLLLDNLGNVYTFGGGSRGQLGHGRLDNEAEPLQVEAIGGIKIVQIAAGAWHSCAISKDGDLYTWGWNGNGQLGLGKQGDEEHYVSVMATPVAVDFSDSERNAIKVACGNRHTIVLLDNNHVHGCGWNKYKQLINDSRENVQTFTYLHDFSNEEIVQLKCGPWNSAVLCK